MALIRHNVFINCPFDSAYQGIFNAILFTVCSCGFVPRCALEDADSSRNRLDKILNLIRICPLGIHDLSRTELSAHSGLPRFNMPFELGLFLGAKAFGNASQSRKSCLILDSKRYRYQAFISDIGGQDVVAHDNDEEQVIRAVRDWLLGAATGKRAGLPSGGLIAEDYGIFRSRLPMLCEESNLLHTEITYLDYQRLVRVWVDEQSAG